MGWVVNATSRPPYPRERPGTHCVRGWVGPRAGLDGCGKSRPTGIRSPDRPARSESLYRLRYPGPYPTVSFAYYSRTMAQCMHVSDPTLLVIMPLRESEIEYVSFLGQCHCHRQSILLSARSSLAPLGRG
jgi:hypothetical protein